MCHTPGSPHNGSQPELRPIQPACSIDGPIGACEQNLAWYFAAGSSGRPEELSLCPAVCELTKEGGALDLSFGCEVQFNSIRAVGGDKWSSGQP